MDEKQARQHPQFRKLAPIIGEEDTIRILMAADEASEELEKMGIEFRQVKDGEMTKEEFLKSLNVYVQQIDDRDLRQNIEELMTYYATGKKPTGYPQYGYGYPEEEEEEKIFTESKMQREHRLVGFWGSWQISQDLPPLRFEGE